jgi:restriction system protein
LNEPLIYDLHQDAWDNLSRLFSSIISVRDDHDFDEDVNYDDDEIYDEDEEEDVHYEQFVLDYKLDKSSLIKELDACVRSVMSNIANKDAANLRADFDNVVSLCEELDIHFETQFEEIESYLDILNVYESRVIYLPKHDIIYTPQLILEVHSELIKLIARNPRLIFEITPHQFEEIIAELFFKKGFDVELTKKTRDGGRDIIAVSKEMDVKTKYLIECKRYAVTNKVSIGVVQRLLGVKVAESANKAILATTSGFTKDARKFANNHLWELDLKDYDDIMSWIKAYRC